MDFREPATRAYTFPFLAFMAFLAVVPLVERFTTSSSLVWLKYPAFLVYPVQTLVCAGILIVYWRGYTWSFPRGIFFGGAIGVVALGVWLAPQWLFHGEPRIEGFNPDLVTSSFGYGTTLIFRLLRLIIVVPLLEEIFWRGFLLRYLTREKWQSLSFGDFSHKASFLTAGAFALVHSPIDMPSAFVTGLLYNQVARSTGSLSACVAAHAVTNLGLGIYILTTRQWGFW